MRLPPALLVSVCLTAACATGTRAPAPSALLAGPVAPVAEPVPVPEEPVAPAPPSGPVIGSPREPIYLHDYYEIEGTTLEELVRSMEERRPYGHNAYTIWHVGWKYEFVSRPGECELASFWTIVQVRYTLPRLVPDPRHTPELLDEWQRYLAALRVHEEQHASFGHQAAAEMERIVAERYTHGAGRQRLGKFIDGACRDVLRDMREHEKTYDLVTDHGRTQGAWLADGARRRSAPAASAR